MKVSIDGILGSAKKINSQKQLDEENLNRKKKEVKSDTVAISRKVNSRLENIESEFREIQSSLTKNQIINHGIKQLVEDSAQGGKNREDILSDISFEGKNVLRQFLGEDFDASGLNAKSDMVNNLIETDISRLKKLQVEVDNILASDLAGEGKAEGIQANIDSLYAAADSGNLENLTNLKVDSVMRLIK
jgi:hypothetical protein